MNFGPDVLSISFGDAGFAAEAIVYLRDDHGRASCGLTSTKRLLRACAPVWITKEIALGRNADAGDQS